MPIELGDPDLRAGLAEPRELIGGFTQHARGVPPHWIAKGMDWAMARR